MTLRHLEIFNAVYQEGSITAAANKLYIAQPTISVAIKELEEHFNQKLFERYSRKLKVTPFGANIYQYSQRVLATIHEMDNYARSSKNNEILRIGTGTTIGNLFLPKVIHKMKSDYPDLRIHAIIDKTYLFPALLLENKLDIIITDNQAENSELLSIPISSSPIVAFCHKSHPFASKSILYAEDFRNADLILPDSKNIYRMSVDSFFHSHNMKIHPMIESIDTLALLNGVKQSIGVSFLPLNNIKVIDTTDFVILNVDGFSSTQHINLYHHKDKQLNTSIMNFVKCFSTFASWN